MLEIKAIFHKILQKKKVMKALLILSLLCINLSFAQRNDCHWECGPQCGLPDAVQCCWVCNFWNRDHQLETDQMNKFNITIPPVKVFSPEPCAWYRGGACPLSTSSSTPICMISQVRQYGSSYVVDVCGRQTPVMWGGSYDVHISIDGKITHIQNVLTQNCGGGSGTGGRTFFAHCGAGGGSVMNGMWTITFQLDSDEATLE